MFSVKYKFPAWKDEESKVVHFDGSSISVADLKLEVAKQTSCEPNDLSFQDFATEDIFGDDGVVPKNSFLIVYRGMQKKPTIPTRLVRKPVHNVPPPDKYVCDRCRQSGHYKANCPTIGNPAYDQGFAAPLGIPSSMTRPVEAGAAGGTIRLPNGSLASLKTNADSLDAAADEKRKKDLELEAIPVEFRCNISRGLLRDPHTVPCCGTSFCAKCILPDIIFDAVQCPSCHKTVSGDKIKANAELDAKISAWKLENHYEDPNVGSLTASSSNVVNIPQFTDVPVTKVERRRPPPRRAPGSTATQVTPPQSSDSPINTPLIHAGSETPSNVSIPPSSEDSLRNGSQTASVSDSSASSANDSNLNGTTSSSRDVDGEKTMSEDSSRYISSVDKKSSSERDRKDTPSSSSSRERDRRDDPRYDRDRPREHYDRERETSRSSRDRQERDRREGGRGSRDEDQKDQRDRNERSDRNDRNDSRDRNDRNDRNDRSDRSDQSNYRDGHRRDAGDRVERRDRTEMSHVDRDDRDRNRPRGHGRDSETSNRKESRESGSSSNASHGDKRSESRDVNRDNKASGDQKRNDQGRSNGSSSSSNSRHGGKDQRPTRTVTIESSSKDERRRSPDRRDGKRKRQDEKRYKPSKASKHREHDDVHRNRRG